MPGGLAGYAADVNRLGLALGTTGLRRITDHASYQAKSAVLDRLEVDVGADRTLGRFGHYAWQGKVRARVKWRYVGNGLATLTYSPAGLWALLDRGAKRHTIGARRTGRVGRSSYTGPAKRLHLTGAGADTWTTGPVTHPGARGRRTLERGRDRIRRGLHAWVREGLALEMERRGG